MMRLRRIAEEPDAVLELVAAGIAAQLPSPWCATTPPDADAAARLAMQRYLDADPGVSGWVAMEGRRAVAILGATLEVVDENHFGYTYLPYPVGWTMCCCTTSTTTGCRTRSGAAAASHRSSSPSPVTSCSDRPSMSSWHRRARWCRLSASDDDVADLLHHLREHVESCIDLVESLVVGVLPGVDCVESLVVGVKSRVDCVESLVVGVKSRVDLVETFVDSVESSIDSVETFVDLVESSVDSVESLVDTVEPDVEPVEAFIGPIEALIDPIEALVVLDDLGGEEADVFLDSGYLLLYVGELSRQRKELRVRGVLHRLHGSLEGLEALVRQLDVRVESFPRVALLLD